jgi:hypothetical protein
VIYPSVGLRLAIASTPSSIIIKILAILGAAAVIIGAILDILIMIIFPNQIHVRQQRGQREDGKRNQQE